MLEFLPKKPLIGMVHLASLPGAPRGWGPLDETLAKAVADAGALEAGGVDALMVENFFDAPFCKSHVPPVTIAAITQCVLAIQSEVGLPLGINVLRNDVVSALSIAAVTGAQFVRCNVFVGAAVTDQGLIEGACREAQETRSRLCPQVVIAADVEVKHAAQLGARSIREQAEDAVHRGGADVLIVSGAATGAETPLNRIHEAKGAGAPVWVGSGVTLSNCEEVSQIADGAIVGTGFKRNGKVHEPVDVDQVLRIVERWKG